MKAICVAATCVVLVSAPTQRVAGHGFAVVVPRGWHGRIVAPGPPSPPALNLGNFPLPDWRDQFGNAAPVRWPADGILITVVDWTAGATPAFRRQFRRASLPLHLKASDRSSAIEGESTAHSYFGANVEVRGRLLEVDVQIGSLRAAAVGLRRADAVLNRVVVSPGGR